VAGASSSSASRRSRWYSPLTAGLCTLPLAAVTVVAAPLSGRIVGSRGPRGPLVAAGIAIAASALALVGLTAHTSLPQLLATYVVFGTGFGLVNAPITNAAVSGTPREQAGVAGVAGPLRVGFAPASHAGWWVVAGLGAAISLLGLLTTTGWARQTAAVTAARLTPAVA